jgi:hypothetical protein
VPVPRGKKIPPRERKHNIPAHYKNLRSLMGDEELFTPVNDDLLALLERLRNEWGSWSAVGRGARVSQRWLRKLRLGRYKTISYHSLDQMLLNLGVVGETQKLTWYTIDELVEVGIWKEQQKFGPHTGVETRFKKGVSGNPSGKKKRPEQEKSN